MLYEMKIMSSTSQLYCQTKMNLKKVICCKQITQTVDKTLLVSTPEAFFLFSVQKVCT